MTKKYPGFLFAYLLCTFFGLGKIGKMPGTLGSLAALPIWLFIHMFFRVTLTYPLAVYFFWICFLALLFVIGVLAAQILEERTKSKDPSMIIIDEVVGQIMTLVLTEHILNEFLNYSCLDSLKFYGIFFLVNFVAFRIFDIFKPSFIGIIDKKAKGGFGVMIDDVAAAIAAAIIINILALIFLSL